MDLLLQGLLGSAPATFVASNWGREPFAREEGATAHGCLATEERLLELLAHPHCDVVLVRNGAAIDGRPRNRDEARAALGQGATIAFRHLERVDAELAALGRRMAAELAGVPNVHVYWSPPGEGSFGWHCDPEDVFLLQVRGSKTYRFRRNTLHPMPLARTMARAGAAHREEGPIGEVLLQPGAWLYLPAGWWHDTCAMTESVAISVGLLAPSPLDLLTDLVEELAGDVRWRRRLPPLGHAAPGTDADKLSQWLDVLEGCGSDVALRLADPATVLRLVRRQIQRALGTRLSAG